MSQFENRGFPSRPWSHIEFAQSTPERIISLRLDALQRKQLLVKRREFDIRILLLEPAEDAAVARTEHVQKRDLLEEPHQHLVLFNVVLAELELQGRLDALAQFTYDDRVLDPGSC